MEKQLEQEFFQGALEGLRREDGEVRALLAQYGDRYGDGHQGIGFLYETTMVYTVFKELLRRDFPLKISWEHPYPGCKSRKADLGLLNEDGSVNSLVEFKIWLRDDGREVRGDVLKYRESPFAGGRYLCIIEVPGGDRQDNCAFLLRENPEMELVQMDSFPTRMYHWQQKELYASHVHLYLFKMKG